GRVIVAADGVTIVATARGNLVRIMRDRHRAVAVVVRSHTGVVGRGHFAGARYRAVARIRVDHRRSLVINSDVLDMIAAVAARIGRVIGPGNGVTVVATRWDE